ncbi:hypothetical protein TRFO_34367 [Tritrichomonas foetus]|uniref:Uncharacterized protein n=1 Tax=Tritrichomonas foetus TaxID=1144522 RepID=A0A1J4JKN2_9EUKA|nr:hypothetical protein TRFO_34367 [Tritrichomonas foetus]|eukprot:OHS99201.1 hypothetical protein TRFO_34367 [Tritrichomonas foetus]
MYNNFLGERTNTNESFFPMFDNFYVPKGQSTTYGHMLVQLPHQYGQDPEFTHPLYDILDNQELIIQWNILNCEYDRLLNDLKGESESWKNKMIQQYIDAFIDCLWRPLYRMYLANPALLHRYPQHITLAGRHPLFQTWISIIDHARYP